MSKHLLMTSVILPSHLQLAILAFARHQLPQECCGLLIGTEGRVLEIVPARNELASVSRYRIDPSDHFSAIRRARASALTVVGAFHSHPRSAPIPSRTDLDEGWPDFLYVIASTAPEYSSQPVRGWRIVSGEFTEVLLCAGGARPDEP